MHLTSYLNAVRLKNRIAETGPQVALELIVQVETKRVYAVNWDNCHSKSAERTSLVSLSKQLLISRCGMSCERKRRRTVFVKKRQMHNTQEIAS